MSYLLQRALPMAFHIHHFNTFEQGINALLKQLDGSNVSVFEPIHLVLHSPAMADYLRTTIAQHKGICANLECAFPIAFLWKMHQRLNPDLPRENIFNQASITWHLMKLLPRFADNEHFKSISSYLDNEQKLYSLAYEIAGVFTLYLFYRGDYLIAFEEKRVDELLAEIKAQQAVKNFSSFAKDMHWQAILWRELVMQMKEIHGETLVATAHRVYFKKNFIAQLEKLSPREREKLPKKIIIFGISSLPPFQLDILVKLGEQTDVDLFFLNPSIYYWGDMLNERLVKKRALRNPQKFLPLLTKDQPSHALLGEWGKLGKDFYNRLFFDYHSYESEYYSPQMNQGSSLLAQIQNGITQLENPNYLLLEGDKSVQIHRCHSKMREVEVLYNELLHIFNTTSIQPSDVVVLSPHIESYAPYISTVFSKKINHQSIPFAIFDRKTQDTEAVIENFFAIFDAKNTVVNAEFINNLINNSSVYERFGFSNEDLQSIGYWLSQSGMRFGEKIADDGFVNLHSSEYFLKRLTLSLAMAEEDGIWQQTLAFNETYGLKSELSSRLCECLQIICDFLDKLNEPQSISQWQRLLSNLIDELFASTPTHQQGLMSLRSAINSLADLLTTIGYTQPLGYNVVITHLKNTLAAEDNHLSYLIGHINFCTLQPMRAIPFKVIAILGMNEEDFPRHKQSVSFNLIEYQPRSGDRLWRDDDRYLFLEMLLSAKEIFYLSYVGESLHNNDEQEPSLLIRQLEEHLGTSISTRITTTHPMTAFSAENFVHGDHQSFQKRWLSLAQTSANKSLKCPSPAPSLALKVHREHIESYDLCSFLCDPFAFYARNHLGVRKVRQDKGFDETEHFTLSALERYHIREVLLSQMQDDQQLKEQLSYKGGLPLSHSGDLTFAQLQDEIAPLSQSLGQKLEHLPPHLMLPKKITLTIGEQAVNIHTDFTFFFQEQSLIILRMGKLRTSDIITTYVNQLLIRAYGSEQNIACLYLDSTKNQMRKLCFSPISQEQAVKILQKFVSYYQRALHTELLFINQGFHTDTLAKFKQPARKFKIDFANQIALIIDGNTKVRANHYAKRILADRCLESIREQIEHTTCDLFAEMIETASTHKLPSRHNG